jgi:8-oxo-dGTP pyrophosphatase MutT (NUDIX family)
MRTRPSVQALIFDDKEQKLLLIKQPSRRAKKNLWKLVRGGIEKGETKLHALKREIKEEVGLTHIKVLRKIHYYEYNIPRQNFQVTVYLVKAKGNEKVSLALDEKPPILDYIWVSKLSALKLVHWEDEKKVIRLLK